MILTGLEKTITIQLSRNFKTNNDLFFQFRLARDLGMTVGELRTTMSNKEYMQWAWFYVFEQKKRNEEIAIAEAEAKKRRNK